ncbi:MAG: Hsp20/alpha crystallin family protein [Pseudobdellovibrio sp.]
MRSLFVNPNHIEKMFNQFENHWMNSPLRLRDLYNEFSDVDSAPTFSSEMKFITEKSHWQLTAELAGVVKDNLKLDAKEGLLVVSGEKTKGVTTGKFEKVFRLPEDCDVDKIEAEFTDGILTLTIPLIEKKTVKSIQLKS